MTDKEKLIKLKKLADAMYYAAQYLTTDASRLHKAMNEYHKFIIHECKEEPVSEELEEAVHEYMQHIPESEPELMDSFYTWEQMEDAFKAGAKWQEKHLWKPADGDDLPIFDREVIAILDYDFGHYKVVYAHRPNPNGWDGTNIDTGEKEHFEPEIYGKGGWNQPHILFWLDAILPYEEK